MSSLRGVGFGGGELCPADEELGSVRTAGTSFPRSELLAHSGLVLELIELRPETAGERAPSGTATPDWQ